LAPQPNFRIYGPTHLFILASVIAVPAILAGGARHHIVWRRRIRIGLAIALLLNSVVWYGYLAARGWLSFPDSLPLELCDATLCLTVISAFTLNATAFDLTYYGALAGTSMALLTPDLWEPFPSFSTVQFFCRARACPGGCSVSHLVQGSATPSGLRLEGGAGP
jgi:uncharacterized membrane protein YwaF